MVWHDFTPGELTSLVTGVCSAILATFGYLTARTNRATQQREHERRHKEAAATPHTPEELAERKRRAIVAERAWTGVLIVCLLIIVGNAFGLVQHPPLAIYPAGFFALVFFFSLQLSGRKDD